MQNIKVGHWCKVHGVLSFFDEIKLAKEVESTCELFDGQLIIEIHDAIEGGEVPLWGTDASWLYLRRPEGIWKARLPAEQDWSSVTLHVKSANSQTYMPTVIGVEASPSQKWRYGINEYRQPLEIDLMRCAPPSLAGRATELGRPLVGPPIAEKGNLIFRAGTEFNVHPDLFYDHQWIFGSVRSDPYRQVAFEHFDDPVVLDALERGTLMIRFSGDLMLPLDARVRARASGLGSHH